MCHSSWPCIKKPWVNVITNHANYISKLGQKVKFTIIIKEMWEGEGVIQTVHAGCCFNSLFLVITPPSTDL